MYYRPYWVCGRYNVNHRVAIMYNLIEGVSYFFEDESAQIIGLILSYKRGNHFLIKDLSINSDIDIESLDEFLSELKSLGLVTEEPITNNMIDSYRKNISRIRCEELSHKQEPAFEKLSMDITSAEMAYTDAVGGITSVMLELTYNCSERCIHCYNPGATRNDSEICMRGDREELTLDDYKRIIDELYDQGVVKVCLSGGDPFSNNNVWKIIDYLYNKDIAVDIYTNGQRLVTKVKQLADYYPRTVAVSIYSGIPEEHDYITRVKGSWNKSISVLKELSQFAVPLNIKCCIMRQNVKTYHLVKNLAQQYGAVPQFEVNITDSIDGDKCASRYLRLTPSAMEIILRDPSIPLYVGTEVPNYGGQPRSMDKNACGAGYNSFCITPEGYLIPCCAYHLAFGNLKEQSLESILNNNKLLLDWQNLRLRDYEECGRYEYCDYCNLCPGNNYAEKGYCTKAGENNCFVAKIRCELAKKLKNGDDPLRGKSVFQRISEIPHYADNKIKREYTIHSEQKTG